MLRGEIDHPRFVPFAVVRDLDPYAKRRVQAILRRCGRRQDTDLRILSDGEDGLRGVQNDSSDEDVISFWLSYLDNHRVPMFIVTQWARRVTNISEWMALLEWTYKGRRVEMVPPDTRPIIGDFWQIKIDGVLQRDLLFSSFVNRKGYKIVAGDKTRYFPRF